MTLKKLFSLLLTLLISIPVILSTVLILDIQSNMKDTIVTPRVKAYITALFILILITSILLIIIFRKLFDFFNQIKNKTQNLANGNLSDPITKDFEKKKLRLSETNTIIQNLETMRLSLIEAQNQTNRFIMGISHDIRTPISIIKGYTEALSDGILSSPEEVKNALDLIASKTQQLEGITESLIDFMRMEAKDIKAQFGEINLYELLTYFSKSCELTLSLYSRQFSYFIDISTTITIKANRNLVLRALDNLFSNAIRYTNNGDIITITAKKTDENIVISIQDSGIGIEEKDMEYIFNLFYRGKNANHEKGLGIGLAVVHNITELHGWKVFCESEKGKGSRFSILIPLENCSNI